ncbi:unnamed protein product [Clonostachys solani]|uniref:Uncharacterized protein n=1 Tax=Clonostachys solani TaxID=160281 RepID=A0A9N9ZGS2_9HYPO|nr:unnamed protein product [Clonostachys solani]
MSMEADDQMSKDRSYVPGPTMRPRTGCTSQDQSYVPGPTIHPRTSRISQDRLYVLGPAIHPRTNHTSQDRSCVLGPVVRPRTGRASQDRSYVPGPADRSCVLGPVVCPRTDHASQARSQDSSVVPGQLVCTRTISVRGRPPCAEDYVEGIANTGHIYLCLAKLPTLRNPSLKPIFSIPIEEMGRNGALKQNIDNRYAGVVVVVQAPPGSFNFADIRAALC